MSEKKSIETKLIHLGRDHKKQKGMVNPPVYKTSTIIYDKIDDFLKDDSPVHTDITYGRSGTPTVHALEEALAEFDNANHTIVTSTGMSALIISFLSCLKTGDHVLVTDAIYKCTRRTLDEEFSKLGIEVTYYDPQIGEEIKSLIKDNTAVLFMESPGSGTFEVQDVPLLTKIAKEHNITTIIDNSWATPLFFKPLDFGVDIAVQSGTKYIGGHSDFFMGIITMKNKEIYDQVYATHRNYGAITTPDNCYMALRGLRSLSVRLKQHEENAIHVAKWLEAQSGVEKVLHPALPSSPGYKIWKRDFQGSTGVFSFVLKEVDKEKLNKFIDSLELFSIGLSWGGYESLIVPYKLKGERDSENNPNLFYVRLHIGLENPEDLVLDLGKALKNLT